MLTFDIHQKMNIMAKKQEPTPKMNVNRMLKTSRTFTTKDYNDFIALCQQQIQARKQTEIDNLKAAKADIEAKLKELGA
jgi:predicted transcriptional regulator